uniref:WAP domain-containing protein n=1 Tax=Varanus komodoensis TaxID=61221 RepID=A0A8D2KZ62_VARKO
MQEEPSRAEPWGGARQVRWRTPFPSRSQKGARGPCVSLAGHSVKPPGECPTPIRHGVCAEMCDGDNACGPGRRCCSNGCGGPAAT